ncbi:extracellular solute-binding protein [candidate division KSB1 bacterium]|nr:extracellular solute-binding protein [candidate division KSB1 bacterium]
MALRKWFTCLWIMFSIPSPNAADVTLRFWQVGQADDTQDTRILAEKYYQRTGIKVQVQPIPWGNFVTKYLTAMAAGLPPDAGITNLNGPAQYGIVGGVLDLQKEFPDAIARLQAENFLGPWQMAYFKGHLFGVPQGAAPLAIIYRKDIFKQLNLTPPKKWSEFERLIQTLNAHNYHFGYIFSRNSGWALGTFVYPYGEDIFAPDGQTVRWDQPGFIKGFQFAIRLWNKYNLAIEKAPDQFILNAPGAAMPLYVDGLWSYYEVLSRAPQLKDQIGIAPFPQADDGVPGSIMGGTMYVIFRDGKHHRECMDWIEFLCSTESQRAYFENAINRGERAQLFLSINKKFWATPLPHLPPEHQAALYQMYANVKTSPHTVGAEEAGRLLDKTIVTIEGQARDYASKLARRHHLSIWELKIAFAQNKFLSSRTLFYHYLDSLAAATSIAISPKGQNLLTAGIARYQKYYAHVLDQPQLVTPGRNILDYAKMISLLLIVSATAWIALNPALRKHWRSYLNIAPPFLLLLVFLVIPILVSIYIAFTKYHPVLPLSQAKWVGLLNFRDILSNPTLWQSLGRSFYYSLLVLPSQLFLGLILAVCLDQRLKGDRLIKFVYFSPLVTSVVSISLIWFALYLGTKYGWVNAFFLKAGFITDPIIFLKNKRTFLNGIIVMSIWQGLAFQILILLAGLQNIPDSLYEAASIDGAGPFSQFFKITLPGLRPQIIFLTVMGTIGCVQVFEQIFMLGGGSSEPGAKFGPEDCGMTMVPYIYRTGFEDFHMGDASAIAYILFVVIFILTYINWKIAFRPEESA